MSYFATEPVPYTPIQYTLWLVPEHPGAKKAYDFKSITYPYNENAGFDLKSMNSSFDPTVGHRRAFMADLGVRAMMTRGDTLTPENTVHYRLVPRSSIYKTGYIMANSEGIIDRSYTGVLKAPLVHVNGNSEHAGMWEGNSYFQIVAPDLGWIHKVCVVESLPSTQRGDGGFGSTDRVSSSTVRYMPTIYSPTGTVYSHTGTVYNTKYMSDMPGTSSMSTMNATRCINGMPGMSSMSTIYSHTGATGATGTTSSIAYPRESTSISTLGCSTLYYTQGSNNLSK